MKLLPWIIAAVVLGVLQTALKYCGITLGGLPTIFLFVIVLKGHLVQADALQDTVGFIEDGTTGSLDNCWYWLERRMIYHSPCFRYMHKYPT